MKTYEYKIISCSSHNWMDELNTLGAEGWRFIHMAPPDGHGNYKLLLQRETTE